MFALVTHCTLVGVTGAFSIALTDGVLTRLPWLNGRLVGRAASRLAVAGVLAYATWKLHAPTFVPEGILVGAVMFTAIDAAIAAMPLRRVLNPPPATSPNTAGLPWGPQPVYAFSPTTQSFVPEAA